jgi:hypothetical protein
MKRIAILVIAATTQPVYVHYISTYWTELIRHVKPKFDSLVVILAVSRAEAIDFA